MTRDPAFTGFVKLPCPGDYPAHSTECPQCWGHGGRRGPANVYQPCLYCGGWGYVSCERAMLFNYLNHVTRTVR